jgi:hypothetical protein
MNLGLCLGYFNWYYLSSTVSNRFTAAERFMKYDQFMNVCCKAVNSTDHRTTRNASDRLRTARTLPFVFSWCSSYCWPNSTHECLQHPPVLFLQRRIKYIETCHKRNMATTENCYFNTLYRASVIILYNDQQMHNYFIYESIMPFLVIIRNKKRKSVYSGRILQFLLSGVPRFHT